MPAFKYNAVDKAGNLKEGILNADSVRQVRTILRERGYVPTDVSEVSETSTRKKESFSFGGRVSSGDLALATRQFSSLLAAGISVERSLDALIEQTESARLRTVISGVKGSVQEGSSLANSLSRFSTVFPEYYVSVVLAGEKSGKLDEVLIKLAEYMERSEELKKKTGVMMIYPVIVVIVAISVTLGLLIYVVPQVAGVFQRTNQTLPWLTRALIASSDFLLRTWGWWLMGSVVTVFAVIKAFANERFRFAFDSRLLGVPVLGRLVRNINAARLANTLAILVGGGVPLLTALQTGLGSVANLPMKEALTRAITAVEEGNRLSLAMKQEGRLFPPMFPHFISSGEESGKLGEMLERVTDQISSELNHRTQTLTNLLEPLLILMMGGMVLVIVLAVLLPIFEMNQIMK